MTLLSRRSLLKIGSTIFPLQMLQPLGSAAQTSAAYGTDTPAVPTITDSFPSHSTEVVREMVIVAHFDLKRVKQLVETRPALAEAAVDWGFGDWENALGAASHMGNRPIAEYLVEKGARPSLFSAAMLGELDVVKAFITARPGVQRIKGPHGISLLDHAKFGGERARSVYAYLQLLGDAGPPPEIPLPESERAKLLGTYRFGLAPSQQIEVTLEHNRMLKLDQLTWTRKGAMGRPLHHLGNGEFHPAGAPAVRIRFNQQSEGMVMTVQDGDLLLSARRRAS